MDRWREPNWVNKMTIRLDFSYMMSDFMGQARGITQAEIDELVPRASAIAEDIDNKRESGEWGFYRLPYDTEAAEEVLRTAGLFQEKGTVKYLINHIGNDLMEKPSHVAP